MLKLTRTTAYTTKDQKKADVANAFIGYGVPGSSTAVYQSDAKRQQIPVNDQIKLADDTVAFVSIDGGSRLTLDNLNTTIEQAVRVLEAGGEIVTDNHYHRGRPYNTGERQLAAVLAQLGATERPTPYFTIWRY